jgi:hypothetical protein
MASEYYFQKPLLFFKITFVAQPGKSSKFLKEDLRELLRVNLL